MKSYRNTKWALEVIGSPTNSEAVHKIPLAHLMGLPEKCTYCITDQLTLSAVPPDDWQCSPRKLQTFTIADKTRFSLHTSFSTSLSLETLQSFLLWSSAADICEPWWINPSILGARWAGKLKHSLQTKQTLTLNKQTFWFVDNAKFDPREQQTSHMEKKTKQKQQNPVLPQSSHFIKDSIWGKCWDSRYY